MRNLKQPTTETLTQWRDQAGALWCAQTYYPNGKKDTTYTIHMVCMVGTTISIPCASVSQLWHEVNIRQQRALPGC
jgi:hypothetical protein